MEFKLENIGDDYTIGFDDNGNLRVQPKIKGEERKKIVIEYNSQNFDFIISAENEEKLYFQMQERTDIIFSYYKAEYKVDRLRSLFDIRKPSNRECQKYLIDYFDSILTSNKFDIIREKNKIKLILLEKPKDDGNGKTEEFTFMMKLDLVEKSNYEIRNLLKDIHLSYDNQLKKLKEENEDYKIENQALEKILNDKERLKYLEEKSKIEILKKEKKDEIKKEIEATLIKFDKEKYTEILKSINTKLISGIDEFHLINKGVYHQTKKTIKNLTKVYSKRNDGYNREDFYKKCNSKENTLTLVQTLEDFRFGGFTSAKWDKSYSFYNNGRVNDDFCFIFSLNQNKLYYPNKGKGGIKCGVGSTDELISPGFLDGFDLVEWKHLDGSTICDDSLVKENKSYKTESDHPLNNGKKNFTIRDAEVYQVVFDN